MRMADFLAYSAAVGNGVDENFELWKAAMPQSRVTRNW
jgi:hypothetical protein